MKTTPRRLSLDNAPVTLAGHVITNAWPLFAAASLLSSRYILVRLNWHYPLHLLALQLAVLVLFRLLASIRRRALAARNPDLGRPSGKRLALVLLADLLSQVVPLPLFAKAVVSFNNTPTLAALGLLSFLPPLVAGLFSDSYSFGRARSARHFVVAVPSLIALLVCEYRLTTKGLAYALSALLIHGGLRSMSSYLQSSSNSKTTGLDGFRNTTAATLVIAAIAAAFEDTRSVHGILSLLTPHDAYIVLANLVATAFALSSGSSIVAPSFHNSHWAAVGAQKPLTVWLMLCSTSLVALYSLANRIVLINTTQISVFWLAAFALMDVSFLNVAAEIRDNIGSPSHNLRMLLFLTPLYHSQAAPTVYRLVGDEEEGSEDDEPYLLQKPEPTETKTSSPFPVRIILLLTFICWISSTYLVVTDLGPQQPSDYPARLDTEYKARDSIDVVISMHTEPLSKLTETLDLILTLPIIKYQSTRLFIYTKDYQADLDAIALAVPHAFHDAKIQLRENLGRDGETYLTHILSHWDTMTNHTIFLQAETHDPQLFLSRFNDYYTFATGMLPLGATDTTCACGSPSCADAAWSDASGVLQSTHLAATGRANGTCSPGEQILLSYTGQFIASAARLRGAGRAPYEQLQRLFVDEAAWVHSEPYLQGRPDDMSNPVFGRTMERMWAALLQCGGEQLALYCPSLLSGSRKGGSKRDCQCLDM